MPRKVFVTGVTGQDGHYLARALAAEGCEVYGLVRRTSRDTGCAGVPPFVRAICGDVTDPETTMMVATLEPSEIYHLAAFSHVGDSFQQPATALRINTLGTLNMLDAAIACKARFYQASSSEIFGNAPPPQSERTPLNPASPYACAKAGAYHLVRMYREAYGMHASNGILFNHESPLRGVDFVTQKVCIGAAAIAAGHEQVIELGNLDARRDWGHADDYVRGMIQMVRHPWPGDYVLATGVSRSVRDLCKLAFSMVGINDWEGHVVENAAFRRPLDVQDLRGDATLARDALGWKPKYSFEDMIEEMIIEAHSRVEVKYGAKIQATKRAVH